MRGMRKKKWRARQRENLKGRTREIEKEKRGMRNKKWRERERDK